MAQDQSPQGQSGGAQRTFSQQTQEPRKPVIHLKAGVGVYTSPVAHELQQKGSPIYYGNVYVGGLTNMFSDGKTAYSMLVDGVLNTLSKCRLAQGTGAEVDIIATAPWGVPTIWSAVGRYLGMQMTDAYGEFCNNGALQFNVVNEAFTTAGTIDQVTNLNKSIIGLGTAFLTAVLPGYAYTPSLNKPRIGDVIFITQAATTYFHRITRVQSATQIDIFPVWQGTTAGPGAGLAYGIVRTGCGSRSRVVEIDNGNTPYLYYAGNTLARGTANAGTIECVKTIGPAHYMAPQAGSSDAAANDVILYKAFLLYGAGTAISWSVAGFPTSFATGFGATDLPALNISIQDPSDEFVGFERMGDQVVAIFEHGIYLVRPTGTIPEFDFQRLPLDPVEVQLVQQIQSGIAPGIADASGFCSAGVRPITTGRRGSYYWGHGGMHQVNAYGSVRVSTPIERWLQNLIGTTIRVGDLSFEPNTGSVVLHFFDQFNKISQTGVTVYNEERNDWGPLIVLENLGFATMVSAIKSSSSDPQNQGARGFNLAYCDIEGGNNLARVFTGPIEAGPGPIAGIHTWSWASDIVFISDVYGDYGWGGFVPRARGDAAATTALLTWTLYGGRSPYAMKIRGTGTYDYIAGGAGGLSSRDLIGPTIDDPYCAIVLSGSAFIELDGADVYPTDTPARR